MSDARLNGLIATYRWADLPLCHNAGDSTTCIDPMGRNHNKLVFLVREGEGLGGKIVVWDEDIGLFPSGDDIWCDEWFEFPAMSLDEWARFDQTVREGGRDTAYGGCYVKFACGDWDASAAHACCRPAAEVRRTRRRTPTCASRISNATARATRASRSTTRDPTR